MSTVMPLATRQQFLADRHVGILSVTRPDDRSATLAVPVWYDYAPDTGVSVITSRASAKAAALDAAGRFAVVAHTEDTYRYVSVEGPISETRPCTSEDLVSMAVRYLGAEAGRVYARDWVDPANHVYVMQPEHWRSADLTPMFEALSQAVNRSKEIHA